VFQPGHVEPISEGEIMRIVMLVGAIACFALTSLASSAAFAAQSCDAHCLNVCQTAASKSWCLNKCAQNCQRSTPSR
jgi:hypothetical protein